MLTNQRAEYHLVEGDVHYDSFTPECIAKHYRGDVVYSPEDDIHFPTLTVDETLRFAARMRTPHNRLEGRLRSHFVKRITDITQTIFGLRHVKSTPVGDAAISGVSGGEKKRVSISEALTLRSRISAWDKYVFSRQFSGMLNIVSYDSSTRGLDASTALEFVRALRIATDVAHISTIVSIYQAAESLYQHFDKVCVIYEGRMAYFGRADQARQYFIDLGFEPAHRQTTSDFLVAGVLRALICIFVFVQHSLVCSSHGSPRSHGPRGLQRTSPTDGCRVRLCILGIGGECSESDRHGRILQGVCWPSCACPRVQTERNGGARDYATQGEPLHDIYPHAGSRRHVAPPANSARPHRH